MEIEDPFGILPLEVISNKAQADMTELINRQHTIQDVALTTNKPAQEDLNSKVFKLQDARELAKMW